MRNIEAVDGDSKNTQIGKVRNLFERDDLQLVTIENPSEGLFSLNQVLKQNIIHFYFCLDGQALFSFGPQYSREIQKQKNYFFYNPEKDVPFQLQLTPHGKMVILSISLANLHNLFVHESIPFLKQENVSRKFYDEREIPTHLQLVLHQLFQIQVTENAMAVYYHGKILEVLSLYFSSRTPDTESCPFLNDEETVRKIKHAKEHLLKNLEAPPGLKELAKWAGLNEYQLKVGFKEIYGNTVYGYLLDHKLDHARGLLDTGKFQVNEVAYQIGYTNPSHFIAAYRKKFGVTPKKYLMHNVRKVGA
jgi:AraC-like DNA-binding protein